MDQQTGTWYLPDPQVCFPWPLTPVFLTEADQQIGSHISCLGLLISFFSSFFLSSLFPWPLPLCAVCAPIQFDRSAIRDPYISMVQSFMLHSHIRTSCILQLSSITWYIRQQGVIHCQFPSLIDAFSIFTHETATQVTAIPFYKDQQAGIFLHTKFSYSIIKNLYFLSPLHTSHQTDNHAARSHPLSSPLICLF